MAGRAKVSRESITWALAEELEPLPFVHAFYEGGSAAFSRVDRWSEALAWFHEAIEAVDEAEVRSRVSGG